MRNLNKTVLTKKGLALAVKANAGLVKIEFTKLAAGNGEYGQDVVLEELLDLKSKKQEFGISSTGIMDDKTVNIKSVITNKKDGKNLEEGYYVKEIGLFARDPDQGEILYSITAVQDQWDYLPAYTSGMPVSIVIEFHAQVENGQFFFDPENKMIASFTFDSEAAGLIGAGAKALPVGILEFSSDSVTNKALKLSGSQYLRVTDLVNKPLLEGINEMTISYDSKPSTSANNIGWTFFAARNDNNQLAQEQYIGIMDKMNSITVERFNGGKRPPVVTCTVTEGWKHVDVVFKKSETLLYINGVLKGSQSSSFLITDILSEPGNSVLYIGKANWFDGEFYNGLLDNFKIYNYAKTAEEIGGAK